MPITLSFYLSAAAGNGVDKDAGATLGLKEAKQCCLSLQAANLLNKPSNVPDKI